MNLADKGFNFKDANLYIAMQYIVEHYLSPGTFLWSHKITTSQRVESI